MNFQDLPHTCACTWWCIQRDSGNKIMAQLALRTRELENLFKLNFTLTMRLTLAILGRPPGRALFNVKSRTLRVLTMVFCWWELNIVTMATPLFFFPFFIESKMQELTPIRRQDMDWERTYFGHSHTSPTLGVCKTQVYGVQVFFCSCSFIKAYRGVVVGVGLMFVGVAYLSFFLIFPWKG